MRDNVKARLSRDQIVGKRVCFVYRSEWDEDDDGYAGCTTFVELDDGLLFELSANTGKVLPIESIARTEVVLLKAEKKILEACAGKRVEEVVASELWPDIGLLLDDGTILFSGECDFRRVGPCVGDTRGPDDFRVSEFTPYWPQ